VAGEVLVCAACGRENPDANRFCGSCGSALAAPAVERRKLVTSVFCDLAGSTAMGEQLDSEIVFELMHSYFDAARAALERHGGAVEKFIGDAVVGIFGVPEAHEDDALRACRAALEIQGDIEVLNVDLEQRFGTGLAVRIGVNTGEVVAGDAARRQMVASGDAVVLGDSVNVAARLEQAARPGEVLLGAVTYGLVGDTVRVEPVAPIQAKGKAGPLTAYRLLEVSARGALPRPAASQFVGRSAESVLLESEFDAVAGGGCRLVTVMGEAGVGKSRLVSELFERIGNRSRLARGTCLSYGEGITYWPVAEIIRDLAGVHDDHTADEARRLVPPRLAQLLGLTEATSTSEQTTEAIAEFLDQAGAERPLVVLVEDIHWAEPALLDLLARLPRLVGTAVLLVCLARPELLRHRPDWPVVVRLEPLDAHDLDALLDSLAAPAGARAQIARAAAGNPLYAEELVTWVREGGDPGDLPTSLGALLGARLDQLGSRERDALERGAVEGEVFHQAAVVELSDQPARPSVAHNLDELSRKDMIRLTAASLAGEVIAYRFKHILVRDAAYRATTKRLRATLHERYARWLEQRVGGRVGEYHEILGYHLETAYRFHAELGNPGSALALGAGRHLGSAGRAANARADVRAAASLLRRATTLLPADSVERLELLNELAYAVDQAGLMREARKIARELYEQASALGERRLAAHGKSYATPNPFFDDEADPVAAQAAYREVIATFEELGDEAGLAAAKRRLARVGSAQGRNAESTALLEEALVHAEASGDQATRRAVAFSLASDLNYGPLSVDAAIPRCEKLLATSQGDRVLEAAIGRRLAELLAMAGRFDEARDLLTSAAPVLDEAWVESASWGSLASAARARELMGDREGAERDLKAQSLAFPFEEGRPHAIAIRSANRLASLYCDQGRWEAAEQCIAAFPGERPDADVEARLAAHRGRLEEALALAEGEVERWERTDSLNRRAEAWLTRAELLRAAGRLDAADASLECAVTLYKRKGNVAALGQLNARALKA
jgi:class 3 adenylate cyclase/tetratricopeptide (TPR) repeat protein